MKTMLAATTSRIASVAQNGLEHYYTSSNIERSTIEHGCNVTRWSGTDAEGVVGPPAFASVFCQKGATWSTTGWPSEGAIAIYVWDGTVTVNGTTIDTMSSFIWLQVLVPLASAISPIDAQESSDRPIPTLALA